MSVDFNNIPAGIRVPLFYAEVNAGQSPYQGPSRTLLIGQRLATGSAPANVPIRLDGDEQALAGPGSHLADMAVWARQNHPFGEIWLLPIADPAGVAATFTITVAVGILGSIGTLSVYVAGEKVSIAVAATDTNATVAANLSAEINKGYTKFGRPMTFPVLASVATNVVTLTARNLGALGSKIHISKDLVGDEGPLQTHLTIANGVTGTGVPALGTPLAALGDEEYDFICSPYADTTSLDVIRDFLGDVSGRWSPMQQLYGVYFTALFDTMSNLASFGNGRNDPNVTIMGVAASPSPPWRWAASYGARMANDKNLGGEVDQAYRISRPGHKLELVGIRPPQNKIDRFTITQRQQLYYDGIASYTAAVDGVVHLDRTVTTYQTNAYAQQDTTWLDVETRLQMIYFVRYMKQRITQKFGRHALADDNPKANPAIVTPKIIKAECVHAYVELEDGGLVEQSDLFARYLVVERSTDANRVNAYLPVNVVNQFRIFAANVTTYPEYPLVGTP
jgi:phage tail sheath gpL-like